MLWILFLHHPQGQQTKTPQPTDKRLNRGRKRLCRTEGKENLIIGLNDKVHLFFPKWYDMVLTQKSYRSRV